MADRVRGSANRWRLQLLVAVAVGALAACGNGTGTPTEEPTSAPTPSPTSSPTSSPAPEPTATTPAEPVAVPVYFVVDTRAGLRLAREWREVTGDPVMAAVETMIAGADDPDYGTTWNPQTAVLGVDVGQDVIAVDLSDDARTASVGSQGAVLIVQQLVHTASEAAGLDLPVELTIEGMPAGELWGAVLWEGPVETQDPLDVRVLVQIDTPVEGAEVDSPFEVSGEAAAFEANVPWRVLDSAGTEVVTSGFTMTSEGQTFAPFSFSLDLEPGTYTVEISEDDPSGGAGGTPMTDTRTVTVR